MAPRIPQTASNQPKANSKKRIIDSSDDEDMSEPQTLTKKQKYFDIVKVDQACPLAASHTVYIDVRGTVYDALLNQTNATDNHNKFYRIQLLAGLDYHAWTRWGRVGEKGQNLLLGDGTLADAIEQFEKKFKQKTGHTWADRLSRPKQGKYTFIERDYSEGPIKGCGNSPVHKSRSSDASISSHKSSTILLPESKLPKPVQSLLRIIFDQNSFAAVMKEFDYDANKLPLGKLSKRTLMTGFERLKELAELFGNPMLAEKKYNMGYAEAVEHISNSFYTVIPHAFGRKRPPTIVDEEKLKKEVTLLESLGDMEIANAIMTAASSGPGKSMHYLDRQFAGLGLDEMTPVDNSTNEFKMLEDYLLGTQGQTHGLRLKVEDIFRIQRKGESQLFNSPYSKTPADRRLLWHGSRTTNFGGILSQGLRIAPPQAPVNGYMFDKGVYFADMSTKSANYCFPDNSKPIGLLLLCEVELGKPMLELTDADYFARDTAREHGACSTWGRGLTAPVGWKDAGCVHEKLTGVLMPDTSKPPTRCNIMDATLLYNEYIVYDVAQVRLRYLLRVDMRTTLNAS